jgi:NTE family protein
VPYWLSGDYSADPLSRSGQFANASRQYLDADATRYVHLLDGGISDNLAMRGLINIMLVLTADEEKSEIVDLTRIRRILLISADGQAANNAASAKHQTLSGIGQILNAVSGTQIDSYNFETMILADRQLEALRDAIRKQRCRRGVKDNHPCDDVQSYLVHLSLSGIADAATRQRLQAIPTGLNLSPEDVRLLVEAGEGQVRDSSNLAQFRSSLGAAAPAAEKQPLTAAAAGE